MERKRRGFDARGMWTGFRYIRYKITGNPLKKEEMDGLKDSLYPGMETNTRYNPHDTPPVNLLSMLDKYGCEYPEFEREMPEELRY